MSVYTLAGGLLFFANLWAIIRTVRSDAEIGRKALWVAFVVLFPVIGVVSWIIFGPS